MFGRKRYPLSPAICLAWSEVAGVALFTHNVCVTLVGLCPELCDSKISTRLAGNFPFPHPQMLEGPRCEFFALSGDLPCIQRLTLGFT